MTKPVFDTDKLDFLRAYSKNEKLLPCAELDRHIFICTNCPFKILGHKECSPYPDNRIMRLELAKKYFQGPKQLELFYEV